MNDAALYSQGVQSKIPIPAHTQLLQDALREAAAKNNEIDAPETLMRRSLSACKVACVNSPIWTLVACALTAVVIIIISRPPFVMVCENNAKQPWRSISKFSWFSACIAVLLTIAVAAGLPFIVQSARA